MKIKIISSVLAAVLTAGSFASIPAFAEDDPIVYTYTNEAGESVDVTQSELDAGHWNADLLGGRAHVVYEDFPVIMNPFVDDFANLSLEVRYLKDTGADDSADITITDMGTNEAVYSADLGNGLIYTDSLDMNSYYQITVTEQFCGEEAVSYTKYISTAYKAADMPDYVTDPSSDDTTDISIIDTEKIRLATTVDENGTELFNADIASYTNVPANEWNSFKESLEENKLYKIDVGGGASANTGFISTYPWGSDLGIFVPGCTLFSEDISSSPMPLSDFDPMSISENMVQGAELISSYGNTLFTENYQHYKVMRYVLRDRDNAGDDEYGNDEFDIHVNASRTFYMQIWYKKASETTVTRSSAVHYSRLGNLNIQAVFQDTEKNELEPGDTVYFVIYNPDYTGIEGSICVENEYFPDDVPGSAYAQYISGNSITCPDYSPDYDDEDSVQSQYVITGYMNNWFDADTYYIDNTADNYNSYSILFNNIGQIINGEQDGTTISVTLYYVDFDDDSHFILKRHSSKAFYTDDDRAGRPSSGVMSFAPKNEMTKYFIEISASSVGAYDNSEYNFLPMFSADV